MSCPSGPPIGKGIPELFGALFPLILRQTRHFQATDWMARVALLWVRRPSGKPWAQGTLTAMRLCLITVSPLVLCRLGACLLCCTASTRYQAVFTPGTTTVGTYTADLKVLNVPQTKQPVITVAVRAAPASAARCGFTGATAMIAGSIYIMTVTGTDPYGNDVPCGSSNLALNAFTVVWAGAAIASPTWFCTAETPARYQAVFTPGTTTVGTYTADLKVYNVPQTKQAALYVAVMAAAASPLGCLIAGPDWMPSGGAYTLTVTGRDRYGNDVPCLSSVQAASLFTAVWAGVAITSPAWFCTAEAPARYQAVFTPGTTTVGTYTADLMVSGVPQTRQPAITVAVTTGHLRNTQHVLSTPTLNCRHATPPIAARASASASTFTGAATSAAGAPYILTITARDAGGNPVGCLSSLQGAALFTVLWLGAPLPASSGLAWFCTAETPALFQAVFRPPSTALGTYTADLLVDGLPQIKQAAVPVQITAGPLSPVGCAFDGPASGLAGARYDLRVTGADRYGNPVPCTGLILAQKPLTPVWAGSALSPAQAVWFCTAETPARYQTLFVPPSTTPGVYELDLQVSGSPQTRQAPLSVTLMAAAASAAKCGFTGATTMAAGSSYTLTVTGTDPYGNSVPCQSPTQAAGIFTVVWAGAAVASPTWSCTAGTPARYQALFTPGTTTVGSYAADLEVFGTAQTSQPALNVTVVADLPSWSQSVFAGLNETTSCAPYRVTVTARDPFDNPVACTPATAGSTFALTMNVHPPADLTWACITAATPPTGAPAPAMAALFFQATFTPTGLGTHQLAVTRDGHPLTAATAGAGGQAAGLAVTVRFGTVSPTASALSLSPASATLPAGQPLTLTAVLRDACGTPQPCPTITNTTTNNNTNNTSTDPSGQLALRWAGEPSPWPTNWACAPGGPAGLVAAFVPWRAGRWLLEVGLRVPPAVGNGVVVETPLGPPAGINVTVTHGPIAPAQCLVLRSAPSSPVPAGHSITLRIRARDAYGNWVPCWNATLDDDDDGGDDGDDGDGDFLVVWQPIRAGLAQYQVRGRDGGGLVANGTLTVTPAIPSPVVTTILNSPSGSSSKRTLSTVNSKSADNL
ncbi:hypothetical protein PAPYR_4497 [Paratrimastix pyriformis]|uniref:Ig-like domain-containing protein n=1 Tax=Paratrimastix pyriformis TaxID=342808 RepID=A0ABQ8UN71_9EUKA|nr:hypothetical protein PAPYR_4497 [Paratrimastix pyriformis]